MKASASRENILKKIRQALSNTVPVPFPGLTPKEELYVHPNEDETVLFAEAFTKLQGKFSLCEDVNALRIQLQQLFAAMKWEKVYCVDPQIQEICGLIQTHPTLDDCDVAVTGCEYLVARTGTIVMTSNAVMGRTSSVYAPIHICIAFNRQLVFDFKEALFFLKEKYQQQLPSLITFATGPSRTADIEKTLVKGIHGPKEVFCFLIDS